MSTTPKKKYSSLGAKYCRLCGSVKDIDRSTNVFSKSGIRKNLAKTISELLQVSIKEDDGLPSNICRQCEGKLFGFSELKSSVINMQSQLKQSVTAKRCKVFSPTLEPDQKVRVVENRSSVRSLTFADENTKPESNISSSLPQMNSDMDCVDHVPTGALFVTGKNLITRPQPLTKRSPDRATTCDPKRFVGKSLITGDRKGGIPVTSSNLEEGVPLTTNTPERGTPATATTRGNPNPMATIILSQAGLSNPGVSLRKVLPSCLQTPACILKVLPSYTGSERSESPSEVCRKETRNKIKKGPDNGVGSCVSSHFLRFPDIMFWQVCPNFSDLVYFIIPWQPRPHGFPRLL